MKITTELEYDEAIARMEEIFDAKNDTPEGDELDVLLNAIKEYEEIHFPIEDPDPIEAIEFRKDQMKGTWT